MKTEPHKLNAEEIIKFGNRVKEIRNLLGMKQGEFANGMGISNSFLSEVEKGSTKVGHQFFYNMIKVYRVNPEYLLFGTGAVFVEDREESKKGKDSSYIGPDSQLVNEMLENMRTSTLLRFAILEHYQRYSFENKELIKELRDNPPDSQ